MQTILRLLIAFGASTTLGWSCSCVKGITPCNTFSKTPVVLMGKVIRDSGEGLGNGPARMAIEEVLHGLSSDVREIEVDTSAMSTCYMRLKLDEKYVIFGSLRDGRLVNHVCSGSFNVRGNDVLLNALRQAEAGASPRLIGTVGLAKGRYGSDGPAGAGIRIVAENSGMSRETRTLSDGQFEFTDISPGEWKIRVDSPGFVHRNVWPREPIQVPVSGCESRWLDAAQDGRISGRVTDEDGKPLAAVPVQAFNFDSRLGGLETSPFREAKTDAEGRYEIAGLPSQDYVVGVNGKKYSDELAYPRVYYPGTKDALAAKRVNVQGTQVTQGIDLILAPPRAAAELVIQAVDENETPLDEAGAKVLDPNDGHQRVVGRQAGSDGLIRLPVWQGETYMVESYRFKAMRVAPQPGQRPFVIDNREGKAGPIQITGPVITLRVILRPKQP